MAEALLTGQSFFLGKKFFLFRLHHNPGISFSLFASSPKALCLLLPALFCVLGIFFLLHRKHGSPSRLFSFGSLLFLAGSLSNLGERLFFGYVTDYAGILLPFFGYLFVNLPDLALLLGTALLLVSFWKTSQG